MKLALVCTEKLPVPPIAGGAVQLYIDGILPYLSKKHEITVYSISYPGLPNEETVDKVKFIRVPGRTETMYLESLKSALDSSFDLIHIFNRPKSVLSLSEQLPGVSFSLSLHNEMFHPEKIPYNDAVRCVERVEFINTVSRFIADGVKYRIPQAEEKLRVVYSGVDLQKHKTNWSQEGMQNRLRLKKQLNLDCSNIVLYVGRLSIKKGVHVLLNAMKTVMEKSPDTALVIVGSKWYGKNETDDYGISLQTLSQSLSGSIAFTGFIPPSKIPDYFNLGDVFVCASQWNEPLARVHYEAMASGLPIITTNRGGNAEVIESLGNGIVIDDYKDPEVMADKISYLLDNPAEAELMGRRGRKLAMEIFSWERVAREVIKIPVASV
ncbi:MAG: glycosyl transferase family 1 [Clostridiales bacterium GWC2_40_7]|nr:MAG: glycosyl transferase family 1 [Clostridiales bacterium GWC2_40_7]